MDEEPDKIENKIRINTNTKIYIHIYIGVTGGE